ncbi:MAG: low molecular weight protein-tyrosine-phosphatase, partial [Aeromicrobium sp.]
AGRVEVASAGTGGWHAGEPMDPRSAVALRDAGYDPAGHRARTFTADWFAEHDLLLAMDASNRADMVDLAPTVHQQSQVRMFRDFDPEATPSDDQVPDPWHGGPDGFRQVLVMIERTVDGLVQQLPALIDSTHR